MALPLLDDRHFIAVTTTGIFCRRGCPAPAPLPGHVDRFATAREALFAGYRACLRCRPLEADGVAVTDAELRRAERLRPILAAARRTRRRHSGAAAAVVAMLRTPLGRMLAGATDDGICLLEFTDRPMLPTQLEVLEHRLGRPVVAGRHPHLDRLQAQLDEYFAKARTSFDVPVVVPGSPFQERTWSQLRAIPVGETLSYEELAERVGRPGAQRAVGTANGANRVALVIPCHRVVRKSGETGNYGGGRWRKAWLVAHEQRIVQATTGAAMRPVIQQ
ncbi:MAG TPA: methylated-DNA--[protein]-cysteine S-methyltransferase [Candidatus Limnocylindria bacterium]|jgi:O-6-methylguanine DNA methyltransferase